MAWMEFLNRPGVEGPFGALMDEYARVAEDFCATVEDVPAAVFTTERPSEDPDTRSILTICSHAIRSARGYANYIRQVRGMAIVPAAGGGGDDLSVPGAVRTRLADALRYTEATLEGLYDADAATVESLTFQVRWGPTYDPEMILEHAIVHLLRHRRQIERWGI